MPPSRRRKESARDADAGRRRGRGAGAGSGRDTRGDACFYHVASSPGTRSRGGWNVCPALAALEPAGAVCSAPAKPVPPDQSQTFSRNILIASFREPQRRACPRLPSEVRDGRVRGSQGPCPAASTMLETALEVIPRERFRLVKGRRPHVPLITAMSPPLLWEMRWRQHFGCRNPIFRGS